MQPIKAEIWLSVEAAAKQLGLKPRRMLDYKDKIRSEYVPNPRSGKQVLQFSAADVERFRQEREKAMETGVARVSRGTLQLHRGTTAAPSPAALAASVRHWLRVSELAKEWEVSEGAILDLIRSGDLPARRFACRDPWRIHRADADALRGQQLSANHDPNHEAQT